MTRRLFDRHLLELQNHTLSMGGMVETALRRSMDALQNCDSILAEQLIANDTVIDRLRYEIEEECVELIDTQQPLASDLRLIISVLNIVVDLERIGDYAKGISSIAVMNGAEPPLKPLINLAPMTELTSSMLNRILESFIKHDAETARKICDEDDLIDSLYDQVFRELLVFMSKDPKTISRATRLVWVAHNLERSADRVANIGERINYLVTGSSQQLNGYQSVFC